MSRNPQRLTPEDWDQWARSPVTEAWTASLKDTIEETKDRWAAGHFRGETLEATARLNDQAVAGVEVLRQAIDRIEEMKLNSQPTGEE